jgi:quercetin dioxygenase-like cupin family protein
MSEENFEIVREAWRHKKEDRMEGIGRHAKAKSVPARSGRAVALLGWAITYLDEPSDTGDAYMLYEQRTASGGMIPPHREDNREAFYILEGTFEIELEGEANRYEVGDFLAIQPGTLHAIRNVGSGWGRIMTVVSPGSQHQRFFDTLGEPHNAEADPPPLTEPPDFERIATVGEASGIHFMPPPEAAGLSE